MIFEPYFITRKNYPQYYRDIKRKWQDGGLCINCGKPVKRYAHLYCTPCRLSLYRNGLTGEFIKFEEIRDECIKINMSLYRNMLKAVPYIDYRGKAEERIHISGLPLDYPSLISRVGRLLMSDYEMQHKHKFHIHCLKEMYARKPKVIQTLAYEIMLFYIYYRCNPRQRFQYDAHFHACMFQHIMRKIEYRFNKIVQRFDEPSRFLGDDLPDVTLRSIRYWLREKPPKYMYYIVESLDKLYAPYIAHIEAHIRKSETSL